MVVGVAAVMRQVRNYFEREAMDGRFVISSSVLSPAPKAPYVYICGSAHCDGVWQLSGGTLLSERGAFAHDETFSGRVWGLHPPDGFLALCEKIADYDEQNPIGAVQSESFGDYSYTRASGQNGVQGWSAAFRALLLPYRRMFTEVEG